MKIQMNGLREDVSALFHHLPVLQGGEDAPQKSPPPSGYLIRIRTKSVNEKETTKAGEKHDSQENDSQECGNGSLLHQPVYGKDFKNFQLNNDALRDPPSGSNEDSREDLTGRLDRLSLNGEELPKPRRRLRISRTNRKGTCTIPVFKKGDVQLIGIGWGSVPARDRGEEAYYLKRLFGILGPFEGMHLPSVPTKLLPHLYMGGKRDLQDMSHLKRLGITHILNCAGTKPFSVCECDPDENGIRKYAQFHAFDNSEYNILQHFPECREFIDNARDTGGKVFVHCHMGINRSGAICAAYIMTDEKRDLMSTIRMMQRKRSLVLMNENFRRLLIRFAKERGLLKPN